VVLTITPEVQRAVQRTSIRAFRLAATGSKSPPWHGCDVCQCSPARWGLEEEKRTEHSVPKFAHSPHQRRAPPAALGAAELPSSNRTGQAHRNKPCHDDVMSEMASRAIRSS